MPASKHGQVQTDKTDGRKFITRRVASNGRVAYRKIYLGTKDHATAQRRARAVQHLEDAEEVRKAVRYSVSSRTREIERRRIIVEVDPAQPLVRRPRQPTGCKAPAFSVSDPWRPPGAGTACAANKLCGTPNGRQALHAAQRKQQQGGLSLLLSRASGG